MACLSRIFCFGMHEFAVGLLRLVISIDGRIPEQHLTTFTL